jgi:hypothetical protein
MLTQGLVTGLSSSFLKTRQVAAVTEVFMLLCGHPHQRLLRLPFLYGMVKPPIFMQLRWSPSLMVLTLLTRSLI